jgi:hypothetical protein
MKRIILGVAVLLITFGFGVGVDRLIWAHSEVSTPTVEAVPAAIVNPVAELVPVVTPVATVPSSPESKIILDYDDKTFYPNGTYYILGPRPKEFAEFYSFETDYSGFVNDQPVGYISINTEAGGGIFDSHSALFGFINPRRIVFVTSPDPKTEFEYLFDGEFIRSDFAVVANKDKAVVRGTLTKMKRGQKIAERVLNFRMAQHGC